MKRLVLIVMVILLGVVSAAAQDVLVKRNGEAVKAKVKNMYENDLRRKYSFDMKLYPSVGCIRSADRLQPAPGMTLAFRF